MRRCQKNAHLRKIWMKMKLMTVMFFLAITNLMAFEAYSQTTKLTLQLNDVTVKEVLSEIEENSEFFFLFNGKLVDVGRKVSMDVNDQKINEILNDLFQETDVVYVVVDRQIVLTNKANQNSIMQLGSQQPQKVTGTVTEKDGTPIPGVNVVVTGTTQGTTTDIAGKYSIEVPKGAKSLTFSFIGMEPQEISIGTLTQINVTMAESAIGLDEVVVIGYGTVKKSDLTGSIASVKSSQINAFPANNAIQALAGRASGVQVLQNNGSPGAPISIRIRGTNSIIGSNEPLYIIDGFPGSISLLNNSEIESVEILKDASATAIYGNRGANGVVLITTRQGKAGKTKVDFESSYGVQQIGKTLDLCNSKEYALLYNEKAANMEVSPYFTQNEIDNLGEDTDWQDVIFRTAPIRNHALTISGGTEKTKFLLSGTIFDQDGIMKEDRYKRYSVRANINQEISKKFSVDFGVIMSRIVNYYTSGSSSVMNNALWAPPTLSPYNDDGSTRNISSAYPFSFTNAVNPLFIIKENTDCAKTNMLMSNVAFSYKLTPDLIIRVAGNVANSDDRNDSYLTNKFVGLGTPGAASVSTAQILSFLSENTITYTKIFNEKHKLNALAGFTYEDGKYTSLGASGSGFVSDAFETYNLGVAKVFGTPSTSYSKSVLLSYLGRINYSYKDRYLVTVSMRADGASKFSEGNKWGYFPSGAFAWRIKEESFLKNNPTISDLKLRFSWGKTGNQAISPYATQVLLSPGKTVFNDSYYTSLAPGTTFPGDLKWETSEQSDIGVDVGFLNNRFLLTVDYYYKKTRDLLNNVTLPSSMGWTNTIKNIGSIQNSGLELAVDAKILDGSFKWNVSGNIAFNRNKVLKLYNKQNIAGSTFNIDMINDYINLISEGHPFGEFYGYLEDGYDDNGLIKYKDLNSDGVINIFDRTIIGDPNPDFIYGFNSTMSFRNFELSLLLQGSQGNDLYNLSSIVSSVNYIQGLNQLREVYYNHWTPENTDAKYPVILDGAARYSDRFVEDGSFLRLRNIQLAYNFPVKKYGLTWLSNFQMYISGQNLLTFTKYSWWDPDVNTYGGSASINQGIDFYSYPSAKSVICGVKVNF